MMFSVHAVLLGTLLLSQRLTASEKNPFENERSFQSVGCYRDASPRRALPLLVANYRNDQHLDWKNLNEALRNLVRLCAEEVKRKGYVYFGVQFWGECWSGPDAHVTYDTFGHATNCYNNIVGVDFNNYVYRLTGEENECHNQVYKVYDNKDRSILAGGGKKCDFRLPQSTMYWYRFQGNAGTAMPDSCVAKNHCSTRFPGWLSTSGHTANVLQGILKDEKVCFSEAENTSDSENCCSSFITAASVYVRNCGRFFVYKLPGVPLCHVRFCGNGRQK